MHFSTLSLSMSVLLSFFLTLLFINTCICGCIPTKNLNECISGGRWQIFCGIIILKKCRALMDSECESCSRLEMCSTFLFCDAGQRPQLPLSQQLGGSTTNKYIDNHLHLFDHCFSFSIQHLINYMRWSTLHQVGYHECSEHI